MSGLSILLLLITFTCACVPGVSSQTTDPGPYDLEGSGDSSGFGSTQVPTEPAGSGDGSGLMSGSGDYCVRPLYRPPPPNKLETDIVTEIRCHLACIEQVTREENVTLQVLRTYPMWPTVTDQALESDCSIYQKVQECRRGCVLFGESQRLSLTRCASTCLQQCTKPCDGSLSCDQEGTQCSRNCSMEVCHGGCQLYEQDISNMSPTEDMLPLAPFEAPTLVVPEMPGSLAGRYRVNVSNASQAVTSGTGSVLGPTSFIFRVIHSELNIIAYFWLTSLYEVLDLSSLACEDGVLVQYAAVNKYGRSSWSYSAEVSVYGVLVPEDPLPQNPDPASFSVLITPDLRPTFWKHSRINISWQQPQDLRHLSHYVVTIHPNTLLCGSEGKEIIAFRHETSALIVANTPLDGPVGGCIYLISVSSQAISGQYIPPGEPRRVKVGKHLVAPVPLNFQCGRSWDEIEGKFQFSVSWSIPDSRYLQEAIRHFRVVVKLETEGSETIEGVAEIPYTVEKSDYQHVTKQLKFGAVGTYYRIEMATSTSYRQEILIPKAQICEFDSMPLPSAIINKITVHDENITITNVTNQDLGGRISEVVVNVEWRRPGVNVNVYDVRVTERQSSDDESDFGEEFTLQRFETVASEVSLLLVMQLPEYVENSCVYLQVRSINIHGAVSNWSSPACILVSELELTTPTVMVIDTTQSPTTERQGLSVEVLYIIIALGVVMLIAVIVLCVFVVLACVQNKRTGKRSTLFAKANNPNFNNSLHTTPTKAPFKSSEPHFQGGNPYQSVSQIKTDKQWELHPSQVVIETKLGHGGFGDVFQGSLKAGVGYTHLKSVAVKLLKSSSSELEKQSFLDHIEQAKLVTNQSLDAGDPGSHVIKMIGCVTSHVPLCLVCEIPSGGDLLNYLQEQRGPGQGIEVTPEILLNFVEQFVSGMVFLSSIGIVHGDLACRNLYLDSEMSVKISDFGLSGSSKLKVKPRCYHRTVNGRLPVRWMAIESLEEGQFSSDSDVWAFGVTVWEIITLGGFPYATVGHKDLISHLEMGERLERPDNCSQEMYEFIAQCWHEEPVDRPPFNLLHRSLQDLRSTGDSSLVSMTINPTCLYYNIVLSNSLTATPEHGANGGMEGVSNYRERRDRIGDKSYDFTDSVLPSIIEDDQENLDQPQTITEFLEDTHDDNENLDQLQTVSEFFQEDVHGDQNLDKFQTQGQHDEHTRIIVVETHQSSESDSISSGDEKSNCGTRYEPVKSDSECTEVLTPSSPSPVSNQSTDVSEVTVSSPCTPEGDEGRNLKMEELSDSGLKHDLGSNHHDVDNVQVSLNMDQKTVIYLQEDAADLSQSHNSEAIYMGNKEREDNMIMVYEEVGASSTEL